MTDVRRLPSLTDRLPLGASGLDVSPFALGVVGAAETVPAAFDAGINFFFVTGDLHWPVYEATRRGLAMLLERKPSVRDKIIVAVATYVSQPDFMSMPFEEVRAAVPSLERIDLNIAGGMYGYDVPRRLEVLKQHRASSWAGARAIGSTFHDRIACRQALDEGVLDIAFVRFNPLHPGARDDLFPHVRPRAERKTLLFNFKSTAGHFFREEQYTRLGISSEFWRPHVTDYYRFALTETALDGVLCSLPTENAVRELADALARGALDDEMRQYLLDLGTLQAPD